MSEVGVLRMGNAILLTVSRILGNRLKTDFLRVIKLANMTFLH